ncbi:uncharacterized protein [Procambarus clarkii]|uniref:uncharacterized protein n=1 Tax=Procambarus clarkii TaxID=6728 RepID=UPI003742FA3C
MRSVVTKATLVAALTMMVSAAGSDLPQECQPRARWQDRWAGSHVYLTAWLVEDAQLAGLEHPLLTIIMEPVGSSIPYDYDVLLITRRQVVVIRVRNGRRTRNELTVSPGLPSGWTAFNLSSSSSHTQLWHNQQTQLVSLPADMTIDRLTIEGSNITVNCHHKGEREEERRVMTRADHIVAIVIVGLAFVGIISIMVVSSVPLTCSKAIRIRSIIRILQYSTCNMEARYKKYHFFLQKRKQRLTFLEDQHQEEASPFLEGWHVRPYTIDSIITERMLWEAVKEGDTEAVEGLLEEGLHPDDVEPGRTTTPHMDAHLLGNKDIHLIFTKHRGEEKSLPGDELIKSTIYELKKMMKSVFVAGECGMYEHEGGVAALLRHHHLPPTITDHHGRSLVHYMASVTSSMDPTPPWQPQDIAKFFSNHEHVVNAVDHWGRTPLHDLAKHPQAADGDVMWDGRAWEVSEAWLSLARILTSYGCDPRIPDCQGQLPQHLAAAANNHRLAQFFQQKCEELGERTTDERAGRQEELVSAAEQGNTGAIRALLLEGVPIMPVTARADPLLHAIRHSQRDAVLMLLSAGAPFCSQTIEGVTPLEAAHNTLGLPAVFPAIMRKAYCERLEDEMTRVSQENESMKTLRKAMSDYSVQVMDVGSRARWIFSSTEPQRRVAEARTLLTQAAHMGLAFTCQLLGLESMYFHSLPGEESPLKKAISHMQTDTQAVLYRDLKLAPVTCGTVHHDTLTSKYLNNYSVSECQALENYCSTESNNNVMLMKETLQEVIDLMKICTGEHSRHLLQEPSTQLLFLIAKHGLVALLHTLLSRWTNVNMNQIVDSASRGTMLHVATIFGQINIVEYVLHHGVDSEAVTTGNFTAAHLAAVTGRPKCLQYILAYMAHLGARVDHTCLLGLTALELMTKYENLCGNCKLPLLSHADALCVKNERGEDARAYKMLQIKGKILNIRLPEDLLNVALESSCERSSTHEFVSTVKEELRHFCKRINDPRFQGKLIPVGSAVEGNEVFNIDHVSFIYEVCGQEASPSWTPLTLSDIVTDDKTRVEVKSHSQMDLFTFDAFKNSFVQIVYDLLKDYKTLLPHMSLAPPFAAATENGVCLYWLWHNADNIKLIRTSVVPVLPATCSYKNSFGNLPKCASQFVDANQNLCLHIANVHNHWMYRTYLYEDAIFSNLGTNQRKVWLACRMLNQLVKGCWWVPEFSNRWHKQPWHTLTLAVQGLPERALKSLFLRELAEAEEWDSTHHMFKRITSVFCRAAKRDMRGKWVPKEQITSFLPPHHYCCDEKLSVCGIVEYLEELKAAQAKQDKIPKVKFV